jgi:hypothetical protein
VHLGLLAEDMEKFRRHHVSKSRACLSISYSPGLVLLPASPQTRSYLPVSSQLQFGISESYNFPPTRLVMLCITVNSEIRPPEQFAIGSIEAMLSADVTSYQKRGRIIVTVSKKTSWYLSSIFDTGQRLTHADLGFFAFRSPVLNKFENRSQSPAADGFGQYLEASMQNVNE